MRCWILLLAFALAVPAFAQEPPALPVPVEPAPAPATVDDAATTATAAPAPVPMEWLRKTEPDTVVCPFRGVIDYDDGEIECGLIQVPENREVAGSRTIELHYVRLVATGKDKDGKDIAKHDDPVIYLTGGPGVGADYYVGKLKDHHLLGQRDLYILEQRGIGNSSAFCPFFSTRNRAAQVHDNFDAHLRTQYEQARACVASATGQGIDMRGYNTFENARDVRALRMALGFERWNVWGISYGSVLAQALAKIDADGIKAMVIDGIVPLDIGDLMRVPSWYMRDLDKLTALCDAQPGCRDAYPDQPARYLAAIQSVLDQPFALTVKAGEMYPDGKAYVFADVVAGLPFMTLYEQSGHPAIPAMIEGLTRAVERRDETLFKAIAVSAGIGPTGETYGAGMALAIHCQDGYASGMARSFDQESAAHPVLTSVMYGSRAVAVEMAAACAAAGLPDRDPAQYAPLRSDLPIVVANGAWDPVTPTPLADYVVASLGNARLVEFPHAGHGPTRSLKCGGEFLNKFFDDPTAPLDMKCVEEGEEKAHYIAPYYESAAVPRAIVMLDEDKKSLLPHGIWAGSAIAVSLSGLLALVFGWFGRRLDREPRRPGSAARLSAGLTALCAVAYVAGLGVAGAMSFKIAPALLLFGLVGWARWVAWLGPVMGALGLITLVLAVVGTARRGSRIGFGLIALAAIALSLFGWYWDLWP